MNAGFDSLRVHRKGGNNGSLAINPQTAQQIRAYLEAAGHEDDLDGPLFRPLRNNGKVNRSMGPDVDARHIDHYAVDRVVRKYALRIGTQQLLPLSPIRNSEFFSNHWLENRLPLEPEWHELRERTSNALHDLLALWKKQRELVEHYGDEQGLEEAFIQPVLRSLGWTLKYQTFLQRREPDYALFQHEAAHAAANDSKSTCFPKTSETSSQSSTTYARLGF